MALPLLYTALTATLLSADPPAPAPAEVLPAPRPVIVEAPFPGYYRRSAYDVWQVNSMSQHDMMWYPRVDYVPGVGYYYVYNGKPYLYSSIYQRWVSPTIQGTPYRSPEMPPIIIQEEEVLPAPTVKPEEKPIEAKPTSTKKAKRPAAKEPERMPYVAE